jgi:hypothetical protein
VLSDWIAAGDCTLKEADRIAAMVAYENIERIYGL